MAAGLRLFTERTSDGAGEPVLDSGDGEELVHVQPGVSIALGSQPPESSGTLYISTKYNTCLWIYYLLPFGLCLFHVTEQCGGLFCCRKVVWLSDSDRSKGYAVDFLSVSLHAVSRDPEAYPSPCIYTQNGVGGVGKRHFMDVLHVILSSEAGASEYQMKFEMFMSQAMSSFIETGAEDEESEGSDSEHDDVFDLKKVTEMRLVPSDPSQLDILFAVFCECAELNPEPVEAEEEHNWVFSAEMDAEATGADGEDFSGNSIGFSNGDHDLSRGVLEVCL
ncbi:hypothetical protein RJ639_023130 [Escallonia herrerae]|uniref:Chloride conductance regulatory protein ICln n=1 Tax=Escallonia herrerae TaxID=1293975 RepID=A0AA89ACE3_9ASTE|nr:hypothetical protein RJ639_023130 [Escallonia herrerae]